MRERMTTFTISNTNHRGERRSGIDPVLLAEATFGALNGTGDLNVDWDSFDPDNLDTRVLRRIDGILQKQLSGQNKPGETKYLVFLGGTLDHKIKGMATVDTWRHRLTDRLLAKSVPYHRVCNPVTAHWTTDEFNGQQLAKTQSVTELYYLTDTRGSATAIDDLMRGGLSVYSLFEAAFSAATGKPTVLIINRDDYRHNAALARQHGHLETANGIQDEIAALDRLEELCSGCDNVYIANSIEDAAAVLQSHYRPASFAAEPAAHTLPA